MTWRALAACRGCDPALFYSHRGESDTEAKSVCRSCPVRIECLADGLEERHGVWGATSERGRRRLRRELPVICSDCGASVERIPNRTRCDACQADLDRARRAEHMRNVRRGVA